MNTRTHRAKWLAFVVALYAAAALAQDKPCSPDQVLYMALEPMKELVGYAGETRTQYLDRHYGTWQEDREEIVRATADDQAIQVTLNPPSGVLLEHADVIVESHLEYVDRDDTRKQLTGRREIARYPLAAIDAVATISAPRSVFREPGALLVVVFVRHADGGMPGKIVGVVPVELATCPRRVYTHDRFTAIRLNRGEGR